MGCSTSSPQINNLKGMKEMVKIVDFILPKKLDHFDYYFPFFKS